MLALDIQACRPVVHHLRQQPAEVDAVGRRQLEAPAQRRIAQRLLHQALAVIEAPAHRQTDDVVTPARQLLFLRGRNQAFWIQHRDLNAAVPVECRSHGTAGIAGRGHEDLQRPAGTASRLRQRRRQKARTEVLERGGRAVKQLQHLHAPLVT